MSTRLVRYVCAGHPGPIVLSRDGAHGLEKGDGIPIGITPDAVYDEQQVQLQPGDQLVFYTDGVLETRNITGEAFGIDRLINALSQRVPIAENLSNLRTRLSRFAGGLTSRDDVTIVGLEAV